MRVTIAAKRRSRQFLAIAATAVCAAAPFLARAQEAPSWLRGEFTADAALALVYGELPWVDERLASFGRFEGAQAYVELLFERGFVEDGIEKRIVVATLTPQPRAQYGCHACTPLIGGAVFRRDRDGWALEARGEILERSHPWFDASHASLELVEVAPGRYGLLHRVNDVNGGIETKRTSIIFAHDGELGVRFAAHIPETPGPGACNVPAPRLEVQLSDERREPNEPGYYDVEADYAYNDGACRARDGEDGLVIVFAGRVCRQVERWRFTGGSYTLLGVTSSSCTPLTSEASMKG
jgi:hypothetical protein